MIVAAIAAAVAAFIYFWNTSEEFRDFWIGLWEAIKTAVSTVVQAIVTFFTETVPAAFTSFVEFFQGLWEGVKEFFSGLWEGMKEIVSTAWETIKNVVQLAVMAIGEFFSTALTIISLPFQFIWENCKEIITTAWEAIKGVVSTALEAIKTGISTAWEAVKTATSTAFEAVKTVATTIWSGIQSALAPIISGIQTAVSTAWSAIQTATSTVFNAVKSTASTVWSGIKSAVSTAVDGAKSVVSTGWSAIQSTTSTVFNAVKSAASTAWNGIKTTVTTVVSNMKTSITTGLNGIKSAASTALNALKSTFTNVFNGVWSFVQGIVGKLKSIFNFSWSLPHIKLPHFSISGSFSLNPPSIPHISVEWYKKAMNNGMILNSPTIFGASGNHLLGGGEAGPEAVVGVSSLMDMIQSAVANTQLAADAGNITIPVYIGGNLIDEMIVTAQQRRALRSGGSIVTANVYLDDRLIYSCRDYRLTGNTTLTVSTPFDIQRGDEGVHEVKITLACAVAEESDFTVLTRRIAALENRVRQIEKGFGNEIIVEEVIHGDLAEAIGSMTGQASATILGSGAFGVTQEVRLELAEMFGAITENAGGETE